MICHLETRQSCIKPKALAKLESNKSITSLEISFFTKDFDKLKIKLS